ncbi:prephenate dehydrogenase [Maribacter sp. 2307ULW6-5]|uniref:prephenate dehydrogenase n=1 Tax=Maribacter sp. 2307ULW6-5 TaxID=3386275 RepID=UPI0039BC977B
MNIFVVGIGLIGGSFVKDVKAKMPTAKVYGIDTNEAHLEEALSLGLIDTKATYADLSLADFVLVSVPVDALQRELPKILDAVPDDCVVCDAGSTKQQICEVLQAHPKRRNFLACHPIAGTEFSGPSAAVLGLYRGKTNIICEIEKTAFALQERALELFGLLGMRIRYMNPVAHDRHIAYVSHLSHISSFMLGKTVIDKERNERDIFDMAGSGFESTVRLAKSSPAMWAPIFEQNRDNVVETLEEYIQNLTAFKELLVREDYEGIYREMDKTNRIKDILKGLPEAKKMAQDTSKQ